MKRTPEQIREYNRNLLQGEGLAMLAMDFFEFSPAVTKILLAMHKGEEPTPHELIELCKVIAEGRRRYRKIIPPKPKARDEVSAQHDFEEAGQ